MKKDLALMKVYLQSFDIYSNSKLKTLFQA